MLIGLCGLLLAHHETLLSGFALTQVDPGDARLNHFMLEHGYRWLRREPGHESLFSPGFFFPVKNVGAYSDILLGAGLFYWLWRTLGVDPETAFQLWVLSLSVCNFFCAYLLFRCAFLLHPLGAATGAGLFAYAGLRINQAMHHQLFPQFWSVLCLFALVRMFSGGFETNGKRDVRAWVWLVPLTVSLQFWSGFYLGWFFCLGLLLAALWAVPFGAYRRSLFAALKSYRLTIVFACLSGALVLVPMAVHYVQAAEVVGLRSFGEVLSMTPLPVAWLHLGKASWFYGWMAGLSPFRGMPSEHEQRLGMGLVTTVACLTGLWWRRGDRGVRLIALVGLTLIVLTLNLADRSAWKLVYEFLPGAKAIRAVARVGLVVLIPMALGLAVFVDRLARQGGRKLVAAALFGFLCLLEQGETTPAFSKQEVREDVAAIVERIGPNCRAFLFSPVRGRWPYWKYQLDAMWASLYTGVPTINGYSGKFPPGWPFFDTNIRAPTDQVRLSAAINRWARRHGLDPDNICWVQVRET